MNVSVIICTHNPNDAVLSKVIESLRLQTLPKNLWQLLIIDNNSAIPLQNSLDLEWHPNAKIIIEPNLGLSKARLTGVKNAEADLVVFADDDNVLGESYLETAFNFHRENPNVGCFGGKSIPVFETTPPKWFFETGINLGCQEYGDDLYISNYKAIDFKIDSYPIKAPIGTGMIILKNAFLTYLEEVKLDTERLKLGRKGKELTSGEDNDIILTVVKAGYEIAYLPKLVIQHLIPKARYTEGYLKRMAYESNRSWVKVLFIHGIHKKETISSVRRKYLEITNWFRVKAWQSKSNYIKWIGLSGALKGNEELNDI